jgi:DNA-binding NarL/FixJ family response regulator
LSYRFKRRRLPTSFLRVLLLEADPRETDRVAGVLEGDYPDSRLLRVESPEAFVASLADFAPDVILSAHAVGGFEALEALGLVQAELPECPFLLLGEEFCPTALECIRSGAADFIRKSNLTGLGTAIGRALRQRAGLRSLTNRQRQVLRLLATGCSNREIAQRMSRSIKTVETHRAQLMVRLGIRDFAGLVRYATGLGVVSATYQPCGQGSTDTRLTA